MNQTCSRCGQGIEQPIEKNASYIMAEDTKTTEQVEVVEAVVRNQATQDAISKLRTAHYPHHTEETIERAIVSDMPFTDYLGIPPEGSENDPQTRESNAKAAAPSLTDFDRVEIEDVSQAPGGTVTVETVVKSKTVQKTGLVHPEHVQDGDEVIW